MKYAAIFFAIMLVACTSRTKTENTLESMGFTQIKAGGYSFFSCGKDDFQQTKFTAVSPTGKNVSGVVCCGLLFKNCTVRF